MSPSRGTALVTGGARRIGRALALSAARSGFDVAIHHRASEADARETADAVRALGRNAAVLEADLADASAAGGLVQRAASALGPVTLLVNNASIFEDDRIQDLAAETYDRHLDVNLRAPILLSHAFAAALPAGAEGQIVNLLDQRVWKPTPQFFSYALSKSALWSATRTMAQALAPRIRVNGIGPGPTLPSIHQSQADFDAEAAAVPLQRRATPEDIADALCYLIDARSVTGQMIAVDGGQHLGWRTPDVVGE